MRLNIEGKIVHLETLVEEAVGVFSSMTDIEPLQYLIDGSVVIPARALWFQTNGIF